MNKHFLAIGAAVLAVAAGTASGQALQRRATITGGGNPDRGKCTIEVVVDGAAEVEVRGDNATLRNLSGQPPQWRRFECTSAMPANPPNFRFAGIDGRGSQELVRAQNGAVVRIQDRDGGAEGYTFDLMWGGGWNGGYPNTQGGPPNTQERGGFESRDRGPGPRVTTQEAVRVCQESVKQQAYNRFHTWNIAFRRTALDDQPGRADWVTGVMDIRRGYDRDEAYRFSCSVNFDTGRVLSAQIDPMDRRFGRGAGEADRSSSALAVESCERAVEERIRGNGYQHVDFLRINPDDRPGRNDWIVGTVRADIRLRSDSFDFSCSVNFQNGVVRSADVRRR